MIVYLYTFLFNFLLRGVWVNFLTRRRNWVCVKIRQNFSESWLFNGHLSNPFCI